MAYGYRRRRGGYRRRYPRKGNGATDYIKMAKTAYQGVKYLKGLVNVEKHAIYTGFQNTPDSVTGTLDCLNLIGQGDTEPDRQGNSVMLKKVHINLRFTMNGSASHTTVRYILFRYPQPQGSTPTASFLLRAITVVDCYQHDNAGLFEILCDKTVVLNNVGINECIRHITKSLNVHQTFDGTTGTVANIQTNALWLLLLSDEATNTPTVTVRAEVFFIDN